MRPAKSSLKINEYLTDETAVKDTRKTTKLTSQPFDWELCSKISPTGELLSYFLASNSNTSQLNVAGKRWHNRSIFDAVWPGGWPDPTNAALENTRAHTDRHTHCANSRGPDCKTTRNSNKTSTYLAIKYVNQY